VIKERKTKSKWLEPINRFTFKLYSPFRIEHAGYRPFGKKNCINILPALFTIKDKK